MSTVLCSLVQPIIFIIPGKGETLRIILQLMQVDDKKLRAFMTMFSESSPEPVATGEIMCVHVNMETRRASPFPDDRRAPLEALLESHKNLPSPPLMGHTIGTALKS